MKIRLLEILYVNPFECLDHEDPYTHLTKFYGIVGIPYNEEEAVSLRNCSKIQSINSPPKNKTILEETFTQSMTTTASSQRNT